MRLLLHVAIVHPGLVTLEPQTSQKRPYTASVQCVFGTAFGGSLHLSARDPHGFDAELEPDSFSFGPPCMGEWKFTANLTLHAGQYAGAHYEAASIEGRLVCSEGSETASVPLRAGVLPRPSVSAAIEPARIKVRQDETFEAWLNVTNAGANYQSYGRVTVRPLQEGRAWVTADGSTRDLDSAAAAASFHLSGRSGADAKSDYRFERFNVTVEIIPDRETTNNTRAYVVRSFILEVEVVGEYVPAPDAAALLLLLGIAGALRRRRPSNP